MAFVASEYYVAWEDPIKAFLETNHNGVLKNQNVKVDETSNNIPCLYV